MSMLCFMANCFNNGPLFVSKALEILEVVIDL